MEEDYDNDPILSKYKFPTPQTDSDYKRLAAINAKLEKEKASQQLIKSALSGQLVNKKVFFSDPVPNKPIKIAEPIIKSSAHKTKKLFDDNDVDGNGNDDNESFKLDIPSKRFKNSKESKLIQLQSRFAHDPRFKIDDKFVDGDDDDNYQQYPSKHTEHDTSKESENCLKGETEKDLDILEEILGKPLKRKFKHLETNQMSNPIIIPRYDPTKPESQKFKIRKVDKLEPYQLPDGENDKPTDKPEVIKERFYEISETFKKDFVADDDNQTDGQSFSLTAMFGRPVAEIPEISFEIGSSKHDKSRDKSSQISKGSTKKSESKQSSDSSDETDSDLGVDSKVKQSKVKTDKSSADPSNLKPIKLNKSKVSNPLLKYERFFFTQNDERFTNNTFYNLDRIKTHLSSWKEKKIVMATALSKKRRHFKHVSKLKTQLESGHSRDKDLKLKYRIYKETTKKH